MDLLYHIIFGAAILAASPFVLLRMAVDPAFRSDLLQRLQSGTGAPELRDSIWIHAASVGETRVAKILVNALKERLGGRPVALSTFTHSGYELARAEGIDPVFRLPPDSPFWLQPLFARLNPAALILVEAELWPGLLRLCKRRGVPVLLVNGRMSERSFNRYAVAPALFRWLAEAVVLFSMRTAEDAGRATKLGVVKENVCVAGNMKFDLSVQNQDRTTGLGEKSPCVVFGSTRPGDEGPILDAAVRLLKETPDARFVLAPRHIERCAEVERMIRERGLDFALHSRVEAGGRERAAPMILLDRMGELNRYYAQSSVAFVGGGFSPEFGGQNIIEPAAYGQPVIFGRHMANFAEEARLLSASGGGIQIDGPGEIYPTLSRLLKDPGERFRRGRAAAQTVASNQGAVQRNVDLIARFLEKARTGDRRPRTE